MSKLKFVEKTNDTITTQYVYIEIQNCEPFEVKGKKSYGRSSRYIVTSVSARRTTEHKTWDYDAAAGEYKITVEYVPIEEAIWKVSVAAARINKDGSKSKVGGYEYVPRKDDGTLDNIQFDFDVPQVREAFTYIDEKLGIE